MLAALDQAWHCDLPSTYRIGCRSTLTRDSLEVEDVVICAAKLEDDAWDGLEASLVVCHGTLSVKRGSISFRFMPTAIFSMHALARRLQRGASTSDDELLGDVTLLAKHSAGEVADGEGFVPPPMDPGAPAAYSSVGN